MKRLCVQPCEREEGEEKKHHHHSKKEGEEGEKKHRHHSKKEELRVSWTNNLFEEAGEGDNLGVRLENRLIDGLRVQELLDTVPIADVRDALILSHHKRRWILTGSSLLHYM